MTLPKIDPKNPKPISEALRCWAAAENAEMDEFDKVLAERDWNRPAAELPPERPKETQRSLF